MRKAARNNRQLIARSYRQAWIAAIVAVLLAGPSTRARTTSLDALLERVRERIAPGDGLARMRAVHIEGVVEMAGEVVGRVDTLAGLDPRFARERLEFAGVRQVTTLRGDEGWIEDANGSVRSASGDELTTLIVSHYLLFHRYLEGPSPEFGLTASERALVILPAEGLERTLILGEDDLPRELRQRQHGTEVTIAFDDWREVQGVLFPHRSRQGTGDERFDIVIRTTRVEFPSEIPEGQIVPPVVGSAKDFTIVDETTARNIEFESHADLVIVDVEVNREKHASFLLDTGAGATVLSRSLVNELGIADRGRMEARGAGGSEAASFVDVASLRLPGVEFRDQTLVAMPLASVSSALGRRIDGILGYDFLSRFAVEIDYARRRLALVASGQYRPGPDAHRIPLRIEANVPRIEGVIEGEYRGSFLLDTGNSRALILHSPFVRAHGLDDRDSSPASLSGIGGSESVLSVRVASIALGEIVFRDVDALLSLSEEGIVASGEAIGNIGSGLFREGALAFDYSEGALWVTTPVAASASER